MIHLSFEPKELDYIATVLSRQPWAEVNTLLVNIQTQVQQQQKEAAMTMQQPIQPNGHDTQATVN